MRGSAAAQSSRRSACSRSTAAAAQNPAAFRRRSVRNSIRSAGDRGVDSRSDRSAWALYNRPIASPEYARVGPSPSVIRLEHDKNKRFAVGPINGAQSPSSPEGPVAAAARGADWTPVLPRQCFATAGMTRRRCKLLRGMGGRAKPSGGEPGADAGAARADAAKRRRTSEDRAAGAHCRKRDGRTQGEWAGIVKRRGSSDAPPGLLSNLNPDQTHRDGLGTGCGWEGWPHREPLPHSRAGDPAP